MGCPYCIRALLCGRCNKLVAFLDEEALARAIIVLVDPPARRVLRKIMTLEEDW
jgi:arsenate reductase-like glutaredoxin family protein